MNNNDEQIEHLPECPICEHSDAELERDLWEFARLLYEIAEDQCEKKDQPEKK